MPALSAVEESKVYIGTSGWAYKEWGKQFYPEDLPQKQHLPYLAEHFNTVEVNASFYRLQPKHNYELWRDVTPLEFRFALKISRYISHQLRLVNVEEAWRRFLEPTEALGDKRGPLLLQFPPSFKADAETIERLNQFVSLVDPQQNRLRLATEFRHKSWFEGDVLNQIEGPYALVIANSSRYPTAPQPGWADFAYFRLHGPRKLFGSSYSPAELQPFADQIKSYHKAGKDCYAYFNNDMHAYAPANAKILRHLIET